MQNKIAGRKKPGMMNNIKSKPPSGKKASVLIVDDAPATLELLERNLSSAGYKIWKASNVAEALRVMERVPVDLVITDIKMPGLSGVELARHVRENFASTAVIIITAYPSVKGAVEAVKTGADEYLAKPFTSEELLSAVARTLRHLRIRTTTHSAGKPRIISPQGLIGESKAMLRIGNFINKAALTSATVLISGESGTGKELVARAIHYKSARASAPFVPVNCGAIPEELLESELFGHLKGAFTGANGNTRRLLPNGGWRYHFSMRSVKQAFPCRSNFCALLQTKRYAWSAQPAPEK